MGGATGAIFEQIDCDHAEQLLAALAPEQAGRLWQRIDHQDWIFRGQHDACWDLTPSAHRGDTLQRFLNGKRSHGTLQLDDAIQLEMRAVAEFADLADASGFELPDDTAERRVDHLPVILEGIEFPPKKYLGMFALAQHHRVPTRLLDWTRDGLIAAYFASAKAAMACAGLSEEIPPSRQAPAAPGRLAVWALSMRYLRGLRSDPQALVVTVPTRSNPNLRAQKGLFTLVRFRCSEPPWPLPAIDKLILEHPANAISRAGCDKPMLFKFTLPHRQAPELLYLLRLKGVSAATAFPGLDSLARAICEKQSKDVMVPVEPGRVEAEQEQPMEADHLAESKP